MTEAPNNKALTVADIEAAKNTIENQGRDTGVKAKHKIEPPVNQGHVKLKEKLPKTIKRKFFKSSEGKTFMQTPNGQKINVVAKDGKYFQRVKPASKTAGGTKRIAGRRKRK